MTGTIASYQSATAYALAISWFDMISIARHSAEWIAAYLENPAKDDPNTQMPAFDTLSHDDRLTIGEFLVSLAANRGER